MDTRADIYGLGVLLYELLTGRTPFDAKELLSQGLEAMRRTIREREPVRPSTRLAALSGQELTTTARRRSLDAPRLISLLRGDLDWIVMKCLEKDRTRRYETASGLAADVQRHVGHEPVVARPPSTAYRVAKFVRRNKRYTGPGKDYVFWDEKHTTSRTHAVWAGWLDEVATQTRTESLRLRPDNDALALELSKLKPGRVYALEVSSNLMEWAVHESFRADEGTYTVRLDSAPAAPGLRGLAWLKREQRETRCWWMHSLYRGNCHSITLHRHGAGVEGV